MKRVLDYYLNEWKSDPSRKSLLIRGARQVGKTFTTKQFAESFANRLRSTSKRIRNMVRYSIVISIPSGSFVTLGSCAISQLSPGGPCCFLMRSNRCRMHSRP